MPSSEKKKSARVARHAHHLISTSQEVDRLEKLIPVLEEAKYGHVYAAGPRKRHGSLVAFRKDSYKIHGHIVLCYDDIDVRPDGSESSRKGLSFRTKNVANVVALEKVGDPGEGYIVATTHLFWHPSSVALYRTKCEQTLTRSFFFVSFNSVMRTNERGMGCVLYVRRVR